jgi:hypothetical protein
MSPQQDDGGAGGGSPSPPSSTTNQQQDGSSRPPRRSRDRKRRGGQSRSYSRFVGKCEEIKQFVYDVVSSSDSFSKTTREIAEYVGRTYDEAGEFRTGMVAMELEVNPDAEKLDDEKAELYHHLTAKLLYLSKRTRPDLQPTVSFLTTRVKQPDVDDYKKLARCMRFLRGTKHDKLTLECDENLDIKWYIDASFAVHPDMRSHTGASMTLGKGSVYSTSRKQRLNTKSSTEAELVGVDDAMPMVIWTRNFMEAQGYEVHDNVVFQDNQSAILLEKNGRRSSGRRTRHINIRYFFVSDRVKNGEMRIEYCPTDEMIADFFTKPLQGSLFRKLRQKIMNLPQGKLGDESVSQECVGTRSYADVVRGTPRGSSRRKDTWTRRQPATRH